MIDLSDRILQSSLATVIATLRYIVDENTAESLLQEILGPSLKKLRDSLGMKVEEILEPHLSGQPITYNHYLTENVQKVQAARHRRELEKQLKAFIGENNFRNSNFRFDINPVSLLDRLSSTTEPDMDNVSCSMAIDMMEAYYKVHESFLILISEVIQLTVHRLL